MEITSRSIRSLVQSALLNFIISRIVVVSRIAIEVQQVFRVVLLLLTTPLLDHVPIHLLAPCPHISTGTMSPYIHWHHVPTYPLAPCPHISTGTMSPYIHWHHVPIHPLAPYPHPSTGTMSPYIHWHHVPIY